MSQNQINLANARKRYGTTVYHDPKLALKSQSSDLTHSG